MGFLSWLKGAVANMLSKSEVESALRTQTVVSDTMEQAIRLWSELYQDSPPWKSSTVQTFNLPASIAAEVAKLVTVEAEIDIQGSPRADYLKGQIAPVWGDIRNTVEFAAAKGGLVFKPYIAGRDIPVDCIQGDCFFPTAFDSNNRMTGGIFVAQKTEGKTIYTRLENHSFKDGTHTITQQAFRSSMAGILGTPCPLSAVKDWADILPEVTISGLEAPLFVYLKMPYANNIDSKSPLGVSVYSRAVETIEQIDRQYSRFLWEFESGERAIHATADLFRKSGDKIELPKGKERAYRLLEDGIDDTKNFFQEFSPTLRDENLRNGLNALLRIMEKQCGLAFGTFSDPQVITRTATEVNYSHQDSYVTVSDIQNALSTALTQLLVSMDALATAANLAPRGAYTVAFDWDDSIVNNPSERKKMFWQYVQAGKFPFWRYLVEFESYTEDDAKEIEAESSAALGDPYA